MSEINQIFFLTPFASISRKERFIVLEEKNRDGGSWSNFAKHFFIHFARAKKELNPPKQVFLYFLRILISIVGELKELPCRYKYDT